MDTTTMLRESENGVAIPLFVTDTGIGDPSGEGLGAHLHSDGSVLAMAIGQAIVVCRRGTTDNGDSLRHPLYRGKATQIVISGGANGA